DRTAATMDLSADEPRHTITKQYQATDLRAASRCVRWLPLRLAFSLALALLAPGCVGAALEGMSDHDVDVGVDKVMRPYEQVGRPPASESLVFILDSVVVGGELREEGDRALVKTIASYMLGESTGGQWATRTEEERAIFGEGQVQFVVYRGVGGSR